MSFTYLTMVEFDCKKNFNVSGLSACGSPAQAGELRTLQQTYNRARLCSVVLYLRRCGCTSKFDKP
jgi:hypothetical protein